MKQFWSVRARVVGCVMLVAAAVAFAPAAVRAQERKPLRVAWVYPQRQRATPTDATERARVDHDSATLRAWKDSVDAGVDRELAARPPSRIVRAGPSDRADVLVEVRPVPILDRGGHSTGVVAYALTVFSSAGRSGWQYSTTAVGWASDWSAAAADIVGQTADAAGAIGGR